MLSVLKNESKSYDNLNHAMTSFLSQKLNLIFIGVSVWLYSSFSKAEDISSKLETAASMQPTDYFGQIVISLVLVLVIIFFSAWMLRRFGRYPGVADGQLKVLGALSVGQRERILLLQVGDEQILVGVTSSRISKLHNLENPIVAPKNVEIVTGSFAEKLSVALQKQRQDPNTDDILK